jgi:hypothetical protein
VGRKEVIEHATEILGTLLKVDGWASILVHGFLEFTAQQPHACDSGRVNDSVDLPFILEPSHVPLIRSFLDLT